MTVQTPIPDFVAARRAMLESQLRPLGVTDPLVLQSMGTVPREEFVPEDRRAVAYSDRAIPIGKGRGLPSPAFLGRLLTEMAPRPGQRALVIGAGTGYSAAVLAHMGLDVTALESDSDLAGLARGRGLTVVQGPLETGFRKSAPFDRILIDGAVELIPQTIVEQLAEGGRLGSALVERNVTRLIVGRKSGASFGYVSIADSGAPILPGFIGPKAFTF